MAEKWLWGPGQIAPQHENLGKREVLERLGSVRERYLSKLLGNLEDADIPYICRLERARFRILAEWDQLSDEEFSRSLLDGETDRLRSMADIAAHLLTHEEKNVDPQVNEPLKHMAEHEEEHVRQVQALVERLGRNV
jgi:rubrerythrin